MLLSWGFLFFRRGRIGLTGGNAAADVHGRDLGPAPGGGGVADVALFGGAASGCCCIMSVSMGCSVQRVVWHVAAAVMMMSALRVGKTTG